MNRYQEMDAMLAVARNTGRCKTRGEKAIGARSPQDESLHDHLGYVHITLLVAVVERDWQMVCEGMAALELAIERARPDNREKAA